MSLLYEISIRPALNGWIAKVGCQTLVYNDVDVMMQDLKAYLLDPDKKQESFLATAVNRNVTMPPQPAQLAMPESMPEAPLAFANCEGVGSIRVDTAPATPVAATC